jgi:pimeloyl-ACP methyl ester carboxylesterase
MNPLLPALILASAICLLAGCASTNPNDPPLLTFDSGKLPPADVALKIEGLGPCTDNPDRTLHLDSRQPVTVFVHGCFGSAGLFRALAQVHAFHGQQTACFTYNDRDSMMVSSGQLGSSLDSLSARMHNKQITVIGHSQGGLIARKDAVKARDIDLRLVTISAPFAGIASAETCGSPAARLWSLGLTVPLCKIITGDKWYEITYASDFIRKPGPLIGQVGRYLKIVTDERGTCRRFDDDKICAESDYVFSLDEQRNPGVDEAGGVKITEVTAGHVEIVGNRRVVPVKLIAILQQNGILNPTEADRSAAFNTLLAELYLRDAQASSMATTSDLESCQACAYSK